MEGSSHFVVFSLEGRRFALPVSAVDRIVRAVEVTPLPDAPTDVIGMINVQGRIVPVLNLRPRCRLPDRPIEPTDQFLIAHTTHRTVAVWIDSAEVIRCDSDALVAARDVLPDLQSVRDVGKQADGLILVYDPHMLFSAVEGGQWARAMPGANAAAIVASEGGPT